MAHVIDTDTYPAVPSRPKPDRSRAWAAAALAVAVLVVSGVTAYVVAVSVVSGAEGRISRLEHDRPLLPPSPSRTSHAGPLPPTLPAPPSGGVYRPPTAIWAGSQPQTVTSVFTTTYATQQPAPSPTTARPSPSQTPPPEVCLPLAGCIG